MSGDLVWRQTTRELREASKAVGDSDPTVAAWLNAAARDLWAHGDSEPCWTDPDHEVCAYCDDLLLAAHVRLALAVARTREAAR